MDVNFGLLEKEIFSVLGDKKIMVLSTCYENRVTARNMSCVIINRKIYFQTDKTLLKYKQILKNSNVALCVDNIQVEGTSKIKKHPFDEENKEFIDIFKENYKGSYDKYSHIDNEVVIEIEPTLITLWKYENGQPCRDFLDIKLNNAYRQIYDTTI
ncbi:MAG: pyridoxamine 5'-phosphate oxidase family protein [Ruminiclostridium sp.]